MSSRGCVTVVSGATKNGAKSMSSKATKEMSSGTRNFSSKMACKTPRVMRSLVAKMAVGRSAILSKNFASM